MRAVRSVRRVVTHSATPFVAVLCSIPWIPGCGSGQDDGPASPLSSQQSAPPSPAAPSQSAAEAAAPPAFLGTVGDPCKVAEDCAALVAAAGWADPREIGCVGGTCTVKCSDLGRELLSGGHCAAVGYVCGNLVDLADGPHHCVPGCTTEFDFKVGSADQCRHAMDSVRFLAPCVWGRCAYVECAGQGDCAPCTFDEFRCSNVELY